MKIAAYAALAVVAASAANAGGYVAPVVEAPIEAVPAPVVDASDWTGFYAGLQYGKGNAELDYSGASADSDFDGFGAHAGYQRDFGKFVAGGELDYNKADLDAGGDADLIRLRARAGYDMGRFLPYVTLGAAHIKGDDDLSETGITYGLGADFKVTEKFTVGAEYSRSDFKDVADVDNADLDTDLVQIRASYHF
ncbi:outer membrane protein [Paracoccus laeviglucosivorans]|uniref:Opacity protein n=1 Tax=Paracoccus laeviglucosivorans TaxID=1197861 RepID=A0A521F4U0_9RHOB|nr:porin family protein [Paracoccus laeviglucosivorans]SMO91174.1 Opacity protein [Paracoccus laeviglucosivorans]